MANSTTIDNGAGIINAKNDINLNTSLLNNTNGSIKTNKGDINIKAITGIENYHTLKPGSPASENKGIVSGNDLVINAGYVYNNNSNITGRDITINSRNLITNANSAAISAKRRISLDAMDIKNISSTITSTNGKMDIVAGTAITNDRYSSISSGKAINVKANVLENRGSITSAAGKSVYNLTGLWNDNGYIKGYNLDFNTNTFSNNSAFILAENNLNIAANTVSNRSSINFKNLTPSFGLIDKTGGLKSDNGSVVIKSNSLNNYYGNIIANISEKAAIKGDIDITLRNDLDNRYGKISGMNNVKLNVDKINNTYLGVIEAGKNVIIDAFTKIDNAGGRISSTGTTKITTPAIYNGSTGIVSGSTVIIDGKLYY